MKTPSWTSVDKSNSINKSRNLRVQVIFNLNRRICLWSAYCYSLTYLLPQVNVKFTSSNLPASITILTILSNFGTWRTIEESLSSMISYERQLHERLVIVLLLMESAYFCLFPGIFPSNYRPCGFSDTFHVPVKDIQPLAYSVSKLKFFNPCKKYLRIDLKFLPCYNHRQQLVINTSNHPWSVDSERNYVSKLKDRLWIICLIFIYNSHSFCRLWFHACAPLPQSLRLLKQPPFYRKTCYWNEAKLWLKIL